MIHLPQGMDQLVPMAVAFLLVATRIGMLFLTAPILSAKTLPVKVKTALLAVVSFSVYVSLPASEPPLLDVPTLIVAMLGEVAVGAAAGLSAQIVMACIETAGQLIGIPMGLGFSAAVDPMTGHQDVVTTRFLGLIAVMVMLVMNVHHTLLALVAKSFIVLPPGHAVPSAIAAHTLVTSAALMFDGAVRLAAPVLIVLLGVMATLGILARVVPKMNLLVLSFGISIGLGLITLRAVLPDMVAWIRGIVMRIEPLTAHVLEGFIKG